LPGKDGQVKVAGLEKSGEKRSFPVSKRAFSELGSGAGGGCRERKTKAGTKEGDPMLAEKKFLQEGEQPTSHERPPPRQAGGRSGREAAGEKADA